MPVKYTDLYKPFLKHLRSKRMAELVKTFPLAVQGRILDIGGTPFNWSFLDERMDVTLLNIYHQTLPAESGFRVLCADGRRLPFKDNSFDLVFCK